MLQRLLRRPVVWSPVVATLVQLALAAAAAAATGGGDFPLRR
jgi:hypothetical protein